MRYREELAQRAKINDILPLPTIRQMRGKGKKRIGNHANFSSHIDRDEC